MSLPPHVLVFEQMRSGRAVMLRIRLDRPVDSAAALLVIDRGRDFALLRAMSPSDDWLEFACGAELVEGEPTYFLQFEGSTFLLDQPVERAPA